MWERTMMPESSAVKDASTGKTNFVKTGKEVEMTTYTFRDEFGDKLIILTKKNDFRQLEGAKGILSLDVKFDEFSKKIKTSFGGFEKQPESKK